MSFAPHHNGDLFNGYGEQVKPRLICSFLHAETDCLFEVSERLDSDIFAEFPNLVYVGNGESRYAKVIKTRAYIVTDEDVDGNPVVEKWIIKNRRDYP